MIYIYIYIYMSVMLHECNLPYNYVYWSVTAIACFFNSELIASHEPTSRAPCSGLWTVPIMDCTVQSHELSLERLASTTQQ